MRSSGLLFLLASLAGCVAGPRLVATDTDTVVSVSDIADAVVSADVVALGELHQHPYVHRTHLELIAALHERRPNMVIAMEMFERDVQTVLLKYLNGLIDEDEFRDEARPWPHYARDYRPVIEFAKKNHVVVLAANAPRPLASKASKEGLEAVIGDPDVARESTSPKDEYWDAFLETMSGHMGADNEDAIARFYVSQCLKDDTMAESITDYLAERRKAGDHPLAVLICGCFHSDYGRGTVQRIKNRMPDLQVRVLSAEDVENVESGIYESSPERAEFVIVGVEPPEEKAEVAVEPAAPADHKPAAAGEQPAEQNPEGQRPAFGFMPDYGADEDGVLVGQVFPGRPAAEAGIEEGDVIVSINGFETPDVQTYTDVLDLLIIGKNATVRVRRGEAEVDLQVKVGSRTRH